MALWGNEDGVASAGKRPGVFVEDGLTRFDASSAMLLMRNIASFAAPVAITTVPILLAPSLSGPWLSLPFPSAPFPCGSCPSAGHQIINSGT